MSPDELVFFAVLLCLALCALLLWKRRKDQVRVRVNRGLRSYAAKAAADDEDEELVVA